METLELKSTKTKWKKSVVQLNSTYEQAKGIWELEEGCIDIQSGEEKKKNEEKWTKPHKPVAHQRFTNTTVMEVLEERGVRKGQVKNNWRNNGWKFHKFDGKHSPAYPRCSKAPHRVDS